MTTESKSLYRKIAAVAGSVGSAAKDGRNKDQGYTYATPASVISAVKHLMAEQALAIVPHLVEFAEIDTGARSSGGKPYIINRVSVHYHILDGETGEEMVVPWQAQAGTYGDDKGLAKAQTIALRTFLIQLFQIPAEDPEMDPDAGDPRQPAHTARPAPQAAKPKPVEAPADLRAPATVDEARKRFFAKFGSWARHFPGLPEPRTIDAWIGAARELAIRPQQPSLADEYDAIDAAQPTNGAAGVAR